MVKIENVRKVWFGQGKEKQLFLYIVGRIVNYVNILLICVKMIKKRLFFDISVLVLRRVFVNVFIFVYSKDVYCL